MRVTHDSHGYIYILVTNVDYIQHEAGRLTIVIPCSVADELASDIHEEVLDAERDQ